jgi:hypothetical protein
MGTEHSHTHWDSLAGFPTLATPHTPETLVLKKVAAFFFVAADCGTPQHTGTHTVERHAVRRIDAPRERESVVRRTIRLPAPTHPVSPV